MTAHATHEMHANSIATYRALNTAARRRALLDVFRRQGVPLTDRECCHAMGFDDMNAVRPRISEMVKDGTLIEVGSVLDQVTHRPVRMTTVADRQMTIGELL